MEVSEYLSFASREPMQPWTRTAVMLRLASLRVFVLLVVFPLQVFSQASHLAPTLSRTAPAREFLAGLGTRAGMLGDESGTFEAWVYPLKLLRDFHLYFRTGSQVIPAESLARTVTVRPESWTISYAAETFRARETLLVPVNEPGAIITIEFETAEPLEAAVSFMPDLTLEWPGSLSGTASNWDSNLSAFYLSENENRFAAFVGSPTGLLQTENLWVSDAAPNTRSFSLGYIQKGQSFKTVVIAGSTNGRDEAEKTFRRLASDGSRLQTESADFYRDYLAKTVNLELPDPQLQQAYDWSRISLIQGVVNNPFVGKSLVAGYGVSGAGNRPGFAWFFGRDSLWSALALDAEGDWSTTRLILEFLARYQRADGKIPHEVSQSASFVSWFEKYPYPFASADATPLYLIAMNDYVTHSGDVAFAKEKWDSIWKAYQFLESTIDASGLPSNSNAGHGWIEQGPLLPVQTELYQAGLGVEAIHDLAALARLVDKAKASEKLDSEFSQRILLLNKTFWSPEERVFSYAIGEDEKRTNVPSVLDAVPMWFGLLTDDETEATIDRLADFDFESDWGIRIISSRDARYNPGSYHSGTVWPLFTGWASVAEYRYHRSLPGFSNLAANSRLAFGGSLGHVTEALSGDYYISHPGGATDQIWSAAMIVNPLLRGLLGLELDALANRVIFSPHVPANWDSFGIRNLRVGTVSLDIHYKRNPDGLAIEIERSGTGPCEIEFRPAMSLRAHVSGVTLNGQSHPFKMASNDYDQHAVVRLQVERNQNELVIAVRDDFGLAIEQEAPTLGAKSRGLDVVSETWNSARNSLVLKLAGIAGKQYEMSVLHPETLASVTGAELLKTDRGSGKLRINFPALAGTAHNETYVYGTLTLNYRRETNGSELRETSPDK